MASDVPDRDLRFLADWHDELGLDRLRAGLIDGTLVAWWRHYSTGKYHEIPRADWQKERAVELAVGWGWQLGPPISFSSSEPVLWCTIYAARRGPSKRPKKSKQRKKADRLRSGRPREYDHDAIAKIAEDLPGIDDHLALFLDRVCQVCKEHGPPIKVPKATLLTRICRPIFLRRKNTK
jgi:hypothetical protein